MDLGTASALVAGSTATAAYLDAKYHISKDLATIWRFRSGMKGFEAALKAGRASMFYPIEEVCKRYPEHRAIWSRMGCYTYGELYQRICQYANYFLSIGIKPGDVVAVYYINSPEFMFIWLGLWAIDCVASMVNYNLAADSLVHCVKICNAKVLIADADEGCQKRIQGSAAQITNELGVKIVTLSAELKAKLAHFNATRPSDETRCIVKTAEAPCLIIYTSGTTGMPKAFAFRINRLFPMATQRQSIHQAPGPGGDTWYDPMPLYHGTGGLMALNSVLQGTTLAIGRSFSTRHFWKDVKDSDATMFVYVGETARYLLSAPPSPQDKDHRIRMIYGNGMRPDVWGKFQERFGIPEVAEFFNSTEGMFAVLTHSRSGYGRGTVGHHGAIMRRQTHNLYVPVKIDPETGDVWRSPKTGFAQREDYNVGGEILVALPTREAWPGYWNAEEASNKKVIRNVFKKGDMFYRPGDALRRDDDGMWYFMDRLGDTYRWKGENVATAEVGEVLGRCEGVHEANVYGVQLPNHDGRAGCAAVALTVPDPTKFDWKRLADHSRAKLPKYAVPVFIRVATSAMGTHNNKQDKVKLRAEGVDPALRGTKVVGGKGDEFYWLHPKAPAYVPFTVAEWKALNEGSLRI